MASFLSALLLVIVVLANSCFTLPVLNEESSTISFLNNDLTTDLALKPRSLFHVDTTVVPHHPSRRRLDEHEGFEVSTIVENLSEENSSRVPRTFEELSTSEPSMFSTEEPMSDKREYGRIELSTVHSLDVASDVDAEDKRQFSIHSLSTRGPSVLTTQGLIHHKRGLGALLYDIVEPLLMTTDATMNNESSSVDSSFTTVVPSVWTTEEAAKSKRGFGALLYDMVEPLLLTTDVAMNNESTSSDVLLTTFEPITQVGQIHKRTFDNETESESVDEPTTDETLTLSSTSRGRYNARLQDSSEQQERPLKPVKYQRKPKISSTTTSTRDYAAESEETSNDSTVPTAVFDQDASKQISNVPSDFLILDETVEVIVTDLPERLSNTTMKNTKEAKPLNQGQKSSDIEEKESDN